MNEQAIWKLVAEGGLAALTVDRLAQETGQNSFDLASLYPDPAFMILVLMEDIHNQTLSNTPPINFINTRSYDRHGDGAPRCLPFPSGGDPSFVG